MKLILNFTRICAKCGSEYAPNSLAQKFCPRCSGALKRRMKHDVLTQERKCLDCGKSFKPKRMDNHFCCRACKDHSRRGHPKVEKVCPSCGKTFVTASTIKRFCGRDCQSKMHNILRRAPMRMCKRCGKLIVGRHTNASWCIDCLSAASNPPPVMRTCIVCGAAFEGRGNKRCCSSECSRVRHCMTTTNYRHSLAEKKKRMEEEARMEKVNAMTLDDKVFAADSEDDMVYGNMVYF